jgi:hypothetical protein
VTLGVIERAWRGSPRAPPVSSRTYPWLVVPILLCGCAPDAEQPFTAVADLLDLMTTVVEPAAEVYWDAVGWIIDASGTTEIRPGSPEEWEAVRNAAYQVAESGNLMMMGDRAVDEAAWTAFSQAMIGVGRRAIEAAEARDEQGVFDVGAEIYAVCTGCHATYARETLRPNAEIEGD